MSICKYVCTYLDSNDITVHCPIDTQSTWTTNENEECKEGWVRSEGYHSLYCITYYISSLTLSLPLSPSIHRPRLLPLTTSFICNAMLCLRSGLGLSLLREEVALPASERDELVIWPHIRVAALLCFIYPKTMEHDPALTATISQLRSVWSLSAL